VRWSILFLAACSSSHTPPADPTAPASWRDTGPRVDDGELILRSAGKEFGREKFAISQDGTWLDVAVTASSTFPAKLALDVTMRVDAATWSFASYDLAIDRDGKHCTVKVRADNSAVEAELEYNGKTRTLDRESRDHAGWWITQRPTLTQSAICAMADDKPHALDSFTPWYVVRTAPRAASTLATSDGARKLDLVKVDELIDIYCDGKKLAIVHYTQHAFIAARAEYDAAAQKLTASDPTDNLWAGELSCPD